MRLLVLFALATCVLGSSAQSQPALDERHLLLDGSLTDAEAQAQRRAQQQRRQDFPESDFRHDSSSFIRVFPIFLFNNLLSSCTSLL